MSATAELPPLAAPTETAEDSHRISGFKTARGSVYTYDEEGKTTRFKTATGEQNERQDITVFVDLPPGKERTFLDAIHAENPDLKAKAYVLERQPDESPKIIRDLSEVTYPDRLYLGIARNGQLVGAEPASLTPSVGANVFDCRHFIEDGEEATERHLGNKVTEILYE